ncbi:MAG: GAF domain-containing protein, partial [Nitrospirae bacterium]|nr:GAF domain-containing protein [Nitrospirota bacterium]
MAYTPQQKISLLLDTDTPSEMFECLITWIKELNGDPRPSIFLLSTKQPAYLKFEKKYFNGEMQPLDCVLNDNDCRILSRKKDKVIGFIEFSNNNLPSSIEEESKLVIAASLKILYRRIYLDNFLTNIKRPVDFTNKETYFNETANLLADALGMEMVAIRELTQRGDLKCISFHGAEERHVDFLKEAMPLPFAEVVSRATSTLERDGGETNLEPSFEIVDDIHSERFRFLCKYDCLRSIKAFAVFPVVVGGDLFGIISCSTSSPIDFYEFQRMAINTTMQIISVAINNFYSYHEAQLLETTRTDQLFDMMALEIAQATRHELRNTQQGLALQHLQLKSYIKDRGDAQKILTQQGELIDSLSTTIEKLRINTASGSIQKLTEDSIKNIWDSAIALVENRLYSMKIKVYYAGGNVNDSF